MSRMTFKSLARSVLRVVSPRTLVKRHLSGAGDTELELSLLSVLVSPHKAAIDVGTNWGLYSAALSKLCPNVYCLEPNPGLVEILSRTLPKNCHVQHAAAASETGMATLHIPMDGTREVDGLASLQSFGDRKTRTVTVPTIPLDTFADQAVGFVKIDVEGAEMIVLGGTSKLLERQSPTVLIEIEERHRAGAIKEASDWFERRHYEGFYIFDGEVHPIASFDIDRLQNYTRFNPLAERLEQTYVNNFIFAPNGRINNDVKRAIAARLASL